MGFDKKGISDSLNEFADNPSLIQYMKFLICPAEANTIFRSQNRYMMEVYLSAMFQIKPEETYSFVEALINDIFEVERYKDDWGEIKSIFMEWNSVANVHYIKDKECKTSIPTFPNINYLGLSKTKRFINTLSQQDITMNFEYSEAFSRLELFEKDNPETYDDIYLSLLHYFFNTEISAEYLKYVADRYNKKNDGVVSEFIKKVFGIKKSFYKLPKSVFSIIRNVLAAYWTKKGYKIEILYFARNPPVPEIKKMIEKRIMNELDQKYGV